MDNKKNKKICLIVFFLLGIVLFIGIGKYFFDYRHQNRMIFIILLTILFMILVVIGFVFLGLKSIRLIQSRKLNAGIKGEEKLRDILSFLPSSYKKFFNIEINHNNQQCEIDSLIISTRGICIVEVKNYKGYLFGEENDVQWTHQKVSTKGNTYETTVRNPIKQANRQAYILSQLLKDNNIKCWIDTFVFIMGCQCDVDSNKVFTDMRDLLDKIEETGKNNALKDRDIDNIIELLK